MSNRNYPIFKVPPKIEKLYLAFLDGNTETANRLNNILNDETIAKGIEESLETPLISKMLLNDSSECRRAIHTEPYKSNLIYFVRLTAIRDCIQTFFDSFLQSTGKATLDETISLFNLQNCIATVILTFITMVSDKATINCNSNVYPYTDTFPENPKITS